jgi:hypothetical protein
MKIEYFISKIVKVICELLNWELRRRLTVSKDKEKFIINAILEDTGYFALTSDRI